MQKLIAAVLFSFSLAVYAQEPAPVTAESNAPAVSAPAAKEKATKPAAKSKTATKAKKELSPKQKAQRAKMKACNASAREQDLHGDPRKAFMKGCLKKD